MEGNRGSGRKGGWRCTGGGRRGGGKRDFQGGGKREKKGKITQHCAILRNLKNAKRREPTNSEREPGLKGTGSGWFTPPVPPPFMAIQASPMVIVLVGGPCGPSLFNPANAECVAIGERNIKCLQSPRVL